ncbi:MAG TPA: amidohydrolase [Chitinophaga sp.]|uniref:amidohydrolase n=1 Tax=Chitinophaga sp. TaxID=1869181 RepID=UPI002DBCC473|nr:amidohydrolase [Chitinophaga sp.]HEU4551748.1 amidohydrolase [Chitinophaga sp.]
MKLLMPVCCIALFCWSCSSKKQADLIIHHAVIYTVDAHFSRAQAMAVRGGKIVAVGDDKTILDNYTASRIEDAAGHFIYPGFIDAHAHFVEYGLSLQQADLTGTQSWREVIDRVKAFTGSHPPAAGQWVLGRGWDQNDWPQKSFPDKTLLDSLFPHTPVLLGRVDGHAAIANQAALDAAGVHTGQTLGGGVIETRQGKLTGILIDNAVGLVQDKVPQPTIAYVQKALQEAAANCFAAGLTTIADCGIMKDAALLIDSLQQKQLLKMRLYVLLTDSAVNYDYFLPKGPYRTDHINIAGFKCYADGALGSRGACLLQDYADKPGWRGFLLHDSSHFAMRAAQLANTRFQLCTHAIGDSANRVILRIYGNVLKGKNDRRWRIEHAQVVAPADIPLFGQYSIIPSVQPTHATSDMYWAGARLGPERIHHAYANQQLLQQNGWMPLGTDFPVEDINPLKTFLAAVARTDASGYPPGGFQKENALTRQQALQGMTIWAAKGCFEEKSRGSLEAGKLADFVILDHDLMGVPFNALLNTRVLATFSGGEKVYKAGGVK